MDSLTLGAAMAGCNVLLIIGHPDADHPHLCNALADAYADGAQQAGHTVRRVVVAALDFPLLQSQRDWEHGSLPEGLQQAQDDIAWAQHLVFFFPLWLGDMPALLKGFLEQVARPGFAFKANGDNKMPAKGLKGRSARVVVTMGMPAFLYQWYFGAHSVKSLKRNILGFVGIAPVRTTLIGMVEKLGESGVSQWKGRMQRLGEKAQ
jgi:putative NADPH-quinone reductase